MSAIGLDINPPLIQTAMVDGHGVVRHLACSKLVPLYSFDKSKAPIPAGLEEWCSDLTFPLPGKRGVEYRLKTNKTLEATVSNILRETSNMLTEPVRHVSITAPSSLAEKHRAWIRKIIQGCGYEIRLFNEDQALLKACPEFCGSSAVLIYNMRSTTVEISLYRYTGMSLRIEQLEIIEQCGLDIIEHALLAAFDPEAHLRLTLNQYHIVLHNVHNACNSWQPGTPFRITGCKGAGIPEGAELNTEKAEKILRTVLMPSFSALLALIPEDISPLLIFLSYGSHPVISNMLQNAAGQAVRSVSREKVVAGAALHAHQITGATNIIKFQDDQSLPIEVIMVLKQKENVATARSRPPDYMYHDPDSTLKSLQLMLSNIGEEIGELSLKKIEEIFPTLRQSTEEFLANVIDMAAKKMINKHDFTGAFKLYNAYWDPHGGFNMLGTPAAGLCLAQARIALQKKDIKSAKRWCRRGLRFSPKNSELLNLKHILKCNCSKCRAVRGQ